MTTLLGTLTGGMLAMSCPSSEAVGETPLVTVVRTGAGAYSMSAPHRALRSWRLSVGVASPHEQSTLRGLLRYASLPLVFVSEGAAGVNGLTPAQSAFHPATLPTGVSRGGAEWVTDPWGRWQVAWTAGTTLTGEWTLDPTGPPVPVVPGGPVTVAAALRSSSATVAPRLGVEWVNGSGMVLSQSMADATISTEQPLVRSHATFTAPLTAAACRVRLVGATQVAALSVTLTPELRPYGEGDGAPEVVPTASSMQHLLVTPGATYGSHDLVLEEVGLAVR